MNYLDDVPEDKSFVLGEKRIKNLYGLLFEFRAMGDDVYGFYVAADHNYFADWVQHVIENKELADKLRGTATRKDAVEALEIAIENIRKGSWHKDEEEHEEFSVKEEKTNPAEVMKEEKAEEIASVKIAHKEEKANVKMAEKELVSEFSKEEKDAKIFLWKHFGWEMAKEFMYGLAFGILIGLILAKMFFR